jgi:hypothetical protein
MIAGWTEAAGLTRGSGGAMNHLMADRKPATERHCTHASLASRGAIALPVLADHACS